jgi:hypothetical protein
MRVVGQREIVVDGVKRTVKVIAAQTARQKEPVMHLRRSMKSNGPWQKHQRYMRQRMARA